MKLQKIIKLFLIFWLCLASNLCFAEKLEPKIPVTLTCISQVATKFNLPPILILSILATEGGQVGVCNNLKIRDGQALSGDIGAMQINSAAWLSRLASYGITGYDLRDNGCLNVYVGAWILQQSIKSCDDLWIGIGRYHSAKPKLNFRYQKKVYSALKKIVNDKMYVKQILRKTNQYAK